MKPANCLAICLTSIALTLAATGVVQAQTGYQSDSGGGQICLHRTADGRCLHWSRGPSAPSPQQYQPTPQARSAPTSRCVGNPATGRAETCLHVTADGRCLHFAGPCN